MMPKTNAVRRDGQGRRPIMVQCAAFRKAIEEGKVERLPNLGAEST
jgi:hypothetical protein